MKNRKQKILTHIKQEDKVMKTMNSKLQKAGMESLTVLAIIIATCFTVNAQGTFYQNWLNNSEELVSLSTANTTVRNKVMSAKAANYAEFIMEDSEPELKLESWMADETHFGAFELETEFEKELRLDEWMVNDVHFTAEETENNQEELFTILVDSKTKTIAVLYPEAQFGRRIFLYKEMEDTELKMEHWMVDQKIWLR